MSSAEAAPLSVRGRSKSTSEAVVRTRGSLAATAGDLESGYISRMCAAKTDKRSTTDAARTKVIFHDDGVTGGRDPVEPFLMVYWERLVSGLRV